MLYDATADFSCSDCLSLSQTQKLHVLKRGEIVSHAVETLFVVRLGTCLPVFLTFTLCSHSHNNHLPWTPPLRSHIPPPPPATPPSAVTEHDPPPPSLAAQCILWPWAQFLSTTHSQTSTTIATYNPLSCTCPSKLLPLSATLHQHSRRPTQHVPSIFILTVSSSLLPPSVSPLTACLCHLQ